MKKRIFVRTPFSHITLKLELKKLTPQTHLLFRLDQNHHANLTSEIKKMCEQI